MFILILILIFQSTNINVCAAEKPNIYARILFEQVYLYKSPINDNSIDNIFFELPKTYFVELIDKSGEFYEAKYKNICGFVKKDSVQAVSSLPTNPFLNNITFRVYSPLSEKIYSKPNISSTLLTDLPHLTKNIEYIGKINGECLTDGRTNIWYFCKYYANSEIYGYVYSDFCDEMSTITLNTENLNYINNPSFETKTENVNAVPKDSNIVGILIGILSIPSLIAVFLIMKGSSIIKGEKIKRKEVIDY